MSRRSLVALIAFAFLARSGGSHAAEDGSFEVIVNADNGLTEIDRDRLRDIYLRKIDEWDHGGSIHPVDLPASPTRDRFERDVIRKTPSQLKNYWNQQIFSGKGTPPPEADSIEAAIEYVREHEGAIAYIPAGMDPHGAKVIRVD